MILRQYLPPMHYEGDSMAKKLSPNELVAFKELLLANSIQVDALCLLLIEKGIITPDEFFQKIKEIQRECESKKAKV